jgi:hypothetical protein
VAGAVFEQYDMLGLEMDGTKGEWFKDPDGNILAIFEM